MNWNGPGRQKIFDTFPKLWWVESDWTYGGMFPGKESVQIKNDLARYGGELGTHTSDVIATVNWADIFRAGDTPSVLYVIDPENDLDDPTQSSWAGRYTKPFPDERPNYWIGVDGGVEWDYRNPNNTWSNASAVKQAKMKPLLDRRTEMYEALLEKVKFLYGYDQQIKNASLGNLSTISSYTLLDKMRILK